MPKAPKPRKVSARKFALAEGPVAEAVKRVLKSHPLKLETLQFQPHEKRGQPVYILKIEPPSSDSGDEQSEDKAKKPSRRVAFSRFSLRNNLNEYNKSGKADSHIELVEKDGTFIANAVLYESTNYDSLLYGDLTSGSINTDIKKLKNSITEFDIQKLVAEALNPLLARTELNEAQKSEIIRASSTSFKSCLDDNHGLVSSEHKPTSWVDSVGGRHKTANADALALPDKARAIWRDDKLTSDTPPDFIKRHYGPWLNVDATGLTRPDIKRLDPSLYMALANWLRNNELPDDCPVPIKSQRLDSELARVAEGGLASVVSGDDPAAILKDAQRLLSAQRRRER